MKIKDSTFFGLLLGSLFLIAILHMSLKNLLKESIFRIPQQVIKKIFDPNAYESKKHIPLADSKRELMDYIKSNIKQINKNQDIRVKGSNFYSQFHQSDIHNQETDLSKYFQVEQPVPEITQLMKKLQCNNQGSSVCKEPIKPSTDNLSGNPMYFDQGSNGNLAYKPDIWTYENERVMNGGMYDGVRGNDALQSNHSTYPAVTQNAQNGGFQSAYPYMQSSGIW